MAATATIKNLLPSCCMVDCAIPVRMLVHMCICPHTNTPSSTTPPQHTLPWKTERAHGSMCTMPFQKVVLPSCWSVAQIYLFACPTSTTPASTHLHDHWVSAHLRGGGHNESDFGTLHKQNVSFPRRLTSCTSASSRRKAKARRRSRRRTRGRL